MGSEKTELPGVCQPHDRFSSTNRLVLIINSGIDLISLDPFGYSWFHSPSIHGFPPIIFHQSLEVLRFGTDGSEALQFWFICRGLPGPNWDFWDENEFGQVLMIFLSESQIYNWIWVYVVFSKWCAYLKGGQKIMSPEFLTLWILEPSKFSLWFRSVWCSFPMACWSAHVE